MICNSCEQGVFTIDSLYSRGRYDIIKLYDKDRFLVKSVVTYDKNGNAKKGSPVPKDPGVLS